MVLAAADEMPGGRMTTDVRLGGPEPSPGTMPHLGADQGGPEMYRADSRLPTRETRGDLRKLLESSLKVLNDVSSDDVGLRQ